MTRERVREIVNRGGLANGEGKEIRKGWEKEEKRE